MQDIRSSNPPEVTGICDSNKSRARHHRSLSAFDFIGGCIRQCQIKEMKQTVAANCDTFYHGILHRLFIYRVLVFLGFFNNMIITIFIEYR